MKLRDLFLKADRSSELEAIRSEHYRLRQALEAARTAKLQQTQKVQLIRDDPQELLRITDEELDLEEKRLRECTRTEAKAANDLRAHEELHPNYEHELYLFHVQAQSAEQEELRATFCQKLQR